TGLETKAGILTKIEGSGEIEGIAGRHVLRGAGHEDGRQRRDLVRDIVPIVGSQAIRVELDDSLQVALAGGGVLEGRTDGLSLWQTSAVALGSIDVQPRRNGSIIRLPMHTYPDIDLQNRAAGSMSLADTDGLDRGIARRF